MAIVAQFQCELCQKRRTYRPKSCDTRRVVCMACRKRNPEAARAILAAAARMGENVEPLSGQ